MKSYASAVHAFLLLTISCPVVPLPTEARDSFKVYQRSIQDPEDGSWVKNFAAIGDSFSAGIGAGTGLQGPGDMDCSRYNGSYANIINDALGPTQRDYQFVACSGDTSPQIRAQIELLGSDSQDLVTITAGGNDVGFENVLKKCVYLPYPESACNQALGATQTLINKDLESNIDDLLHDLNKAMKVNGIAVYVLYAKFFNEGTDACDDQSWVYVDPSGSSGLKLTKARRKQMNDMVISSNQKIQNAITTFHRRYDTAKMALVTAEWDNFVGATQGRFCEDGALQDPKDNHGLAFHRQDNTPRFIPPSEEQLDNQLRKKSLVLSRVEPQEGSAYIRQRAPDDIAKVFRPTIFGHAVIANFVWAAMARARNKMLGGPEHFGQFRCPRCSHDAGTDMLPGEEAKGAFGDPIIPICGKCSDLYTSPSDIGAATEKYCSNQGKYFFMDDEAGKSNMNGGPQSHILTKGTSIKHQADGFYQNSTACKTFDERINTDDCLFALRAIDSTCNPAGKPPAGYCPGGYTYKYTSWGISTDP